MPKNYYFILGIPATSSQRDIKSAFRRLAKEYHPDHYGDGHSPFQNIQEAYSVLSDPESRKAYDKLSRTPKIRSRPGSGTFNAEPMRYRHHLKVEPLNPATEDPETFTAAGPSRAFHASRPAVDAVFDFLAKTFNEPDRYSAAFSKNQTIVITLTPTEALSGGHVRVRLPARFQCTNCLGDGYRGFYECRRCRGAGSVTGLYPLIINYPPGIRNNQTLRLSLERSGLRNRFLSVNFKISGYKYR